MTVRSATAPRDDELAVEGLRAGDEDVFSRLIARLQSSLVHVAMSYVRDRAVAEDVVQDTWLAVLKGIDGFEGRSSLRTWITRILINQAKSRAVAESRTLPFPTLGAPSTAVDGPNTSLDALSGGLDASSGRWLHPPSSWDGIPEERLVSGEMRRHITAAIEGLPSLQQRVIALRDIQGLPSSEVCALLRISEANQRVLLHRARAKVRSALATYLAAC